MQVERDSKIWSVARSADGTLTATGDGNGLILVGRVKDGSTVHILKSHRTEVTNLAFSNDGKMNFIRSSSTLVSFHGMGSSSKPILAVSPMCPV